MIQGNVENVSAFYQTQNMYHSKAHSRQLEKERDRGRKRGPDTAKYAYCVLVRNVCVGFHYRVFFSTLRHSIETCAEKHAFSISIVSAIYEDAYLFEIQQLD